MSKIRTTYNPGVGIVYIIENTKTGEKIKASTLTTRDADQKPWRSPRGTPEGQEFFKMKSGNKKKGFSYYKFMNSIKHETCLSEDGNWLFTGLKPDGTVIPKLTDIVKKERTTTELPEIGSNVVRSKVEKVDTAAPMTTERIKEQIESISVDDFSAADQLQELLSEKETV
jgi:hypothetical protein